MSEIKLENVGLTIGDSVILNDINEIIYKGELYCILGSSGSGKSSLLKVINGLLIEIQGSVIVEGKSIYNYTPSQMLQFHNRCGFVFQNAALINNMTLFENLALPFLYHTSLANVDIYEKIEPYLSHFEIDINILEQRPAFLSTGEKHILGIIRALMREPEYIFWDQPLSTLDHINQTRVKKLISKYKKKGVTNVMVTNDSGFALKYADRIGILHQGGLIASMTPKQLKSSQNPVIKNLISN